MRPARPQGLESVRMYPSSRSRAVLCTIFAAAQAFAASDAHAQAKSVPNFNMVPITITSVTPQGGQLVATGVAGTTPFTAPLTLNAGAIPENGVCPILDLSLGPIHLDLLGLQVDTSPICLKITAHQREGLLGERRSVDRSYDVTEEFDHDEEDPAPPRAGSASFAWLLVRAAGVMLDGEPDERVRPLQIELFADAGAMELDRAHFARHCWRPSTPVGQVL